MGSPRSRPYWLVFAAILALLPLALWRASVSSRVALWGGLAVAPMWGSLARWGYVDDAAAVSLLVVARKPLRLLVGAGVMPQAGWRVGQLGAVMAVAWLCQRRGRPDAALLDAMAVKLALDANDPDYC